MAVSVNISIKGLNKSINALRGLNSDINNTKEPLILASKEYLKVIKQNFTREGKTFGEPWEPLKESTIAIKRDLKSKGRSVGVKKPLYRTGLLRKSFGFELLSKYRASIFNAQPYAKIHQEGGMTTLENKKTKTKTIVRIPRRVLMKIDEERVKMIFNIFENWMGRKIRNRGLSPGGKK